MQKHTPPGLHQAQTREALRIAKHYFGGTDAGHISSDEKLKQSQIEMQRNFGQRCLWYLQDLGFKVYKP